MIFTDAIAIGGGHVTNDLAHGLGTSAVHAERIKTLYGNVLPSPADDRDLIEVPMIGDGEGDPTRQVRRSGLLGIIRPRIEETLEFVRGRLDAAGIGKRAGRRLVLTGGASQLAGLHELAARVLDKQIRLGRPLRIDGLPEATGGPAFSTGAGLLKLALREPPVAVKDLGDLRVDGGSFGRVGRWLKANL